MNNIKEDTLNYLINYINVDYKDITYYTDNYYIEYYPSKNIIYMINDGHLSKIGNLFDIVRSDDEIRFELYGDLLGILKNYESNIVDIELFVNDNNYIVIILRYNSQDDTNILEMPTELYVNIFQSLNYKDIKDISLISKGFHNTSKIERIWIDLIVKKFPLYWKPINNKIIYNYKLIYEALLHADVKEPKNLWKHYIKFFIYINIKHKFYEIGSNVDNELPCVINELLKYVIDNQLIESNVDILLIFAYYNETKYYEMLLKNIGNINHNYIYSLFNIIIESNNYNLLNIYIRYLGIDNNLHSVYEIINDINDTNKFVRHLLLSEYINIDIKDNILIEITSNNDTDISKIIELLSIYREYIDVDIISSIFDVSTNIHVIKYFIKNYNQFITLNILNKILINMENKNIRDNHLFAIIFNHPLMRTEYLNDD